MLGEQVGLQDRLFYEFNIEDRVPSNHLLRRLDAVLDLIWLHTFRTAIFAPHQRQFGWPKIFFLLHQSHSSKILRNSSGIGIVFFVSVSKNTLMQSALAIGKSPFKTS